MDTHDTPPQHTPEHSSPWRQPVIWLVIALVAASVIGGITMIVIASNAGNDDAVADPVQRTAQVQTADLGPDAAARERKLSAIVRVDAELQLVEVLPVDGDFNPAAPLQLHLRHPVEAAEDVTLQLQPTELGWRTETEIAADHDWNVELGPADGSWRLQGRLPAGQQAAHLRPALPDQ